MGIAVVNTKLLINKKLDKESWHCNSNSDSNICEPVSTKTAYLLV